MNVLVVKIAAIGDFLMATPALRALKLNPAVDRVILLAGLSIVPVVEGNPHLDQIYTLDDARIFRGAFLAKLWEVLKISWRLRREKIDLGFNFHRDWRFNIILFLAGCKKRIGFARGRKSRLLTTRVAVEGVKHHIFHYCDLLKTQGIFCLDFKMEFLVGADAVNAAEAKFLREKQISDYVVLVPGGAANVKEEMDSRRWGTENFAALAGLLVASGRQVVLLGSRGDQKISRLIIEAQPQVIDFCGQTSLSEAAVLLKKSRLVVSNDSGLMHLADAVGAKIIAIFGPTHPEEKKPLTAGNIVVWKGEDLECSPCYHDGAFPECRHRSCFKKIFPQEIFELTKTF
ncbi:MAG: lipopolysaccharide heptosyltransferase II [Candidatus Aminicenantes bacterium]|nr:lipopolysaccharide heptosyltransferase II [Candidatus Aminicenantes bacterium]